MTDGSCSHTGGFCVLRALQSPGAPFLTIVPTGAGQATISWAPATPGWLSQETPGFSPTTWIDSTSGSTTPTIVPAAGAMKFYRLRTSE